MRIAKSRVVNLFIILGCPKAAKWNDEILAGRVATMHEVFDLEMQVGEQYQKLFEKVYNDSKDNTAIEIIDDSILHNKKFRRTVFAMIRRAKRATVSQIVGRYKYKYSKAVLQYFLDWCVDHRLLFLKEVIHQNHQKTCYYYVR
jgi:hypothetical protein